MRTNPQKLPDAWRLMNVFRFCRQGLTALPVVLALMACDKLLPPSGSGVDIPVKIRAVRVAGGAQNEIARASEGRLFRFKQGRASHEICPYGGNRRSPLANDGGAF